MFIIHDKFLYLNEHIHLLASRYIRCIPTEMFFKNRWCLFKNHVIFNDKSESFLISETDIKMTSSERKMVTFSLTTISLSYSC